MVLYELAVRECVLEIADVGPYLVVEEHEWMKIRQQIDSVETLCCKRGCKRRITAPGEEYSDAVTHLESLSARLLITRTTDPTKGNPIAPSTARPRLRIIDRTRDSLT